MLWKSWLRAAASIVFLSAGACAATRQARAEPREASAVVLPDAPSATEGGPLLGDPLFAQATTPQGQAAAGATQTAATPPAADAKQSTAPSQAPAPGDYDFKRAEHQRILGIMPEFQAVNTGGVVQPLTPGEKFHLMWKSSTDPFIFALDSIVAGIGQAKDSNPGFHQGAEGYFKRFGASYADTFDGNFWGNAVLTVALKEDPRYFRMGEGHSPLRRALYSATTAVWTRRDNGKTGPNYANVLGNLISGGISNAYYPAADRGIDKTFTGAITVTAEGTVGSELIEFWPDVAHKLFPKRYQQQMQPGAVREGVPTGSKH